jgi:membrane-bound hydrogenase subunit beta
MNEEEKIQQNLLNRFSFLENKIVIKRAKRIFAQVPAENFMEVFEYAVKELQFPILCALTGLDEGETFGLLYHLARENGTTLNIKMNIPRANPVIKTVTDLFLSAEIYERELVDLLGIAVNGLKPGKRYPLPDDWPVGDYPLRKDWKPRAPAVKEETKNA